MTRRRPLLLAMPVKMDIHDITSNKYFLISRGLLRGALDAEGFNDIEKCFGDAKTIAIDTENAYFAFKKGGTSNIKAGLTDVA